MKTVNIQTTWGTITLTLKDEKVIGCALPFLKNTPRVSFKMEDIKSLEALTAKFPTAGIADGTDFQKAVWREMEKIPRGQTRTYGEIAKAIGNPKAVRAVGSACGANPVPLFIPCHRVTGQNGLGGFGAGLPWKKLLLNMEQVRWP